MPDNEDSAIVRPLQPATSLRPDRRQIAGEVLETVDGRRLHGFLQVGKDFSTWIKDRIAAYGFSENTDFVVFPGSGENSGGGRPSREYALTLDMAKELSMVERNDQGRLARRYFIECEKQVKSAAAPTIPTTLPEALRLAADAAEQAQRAEAALALAAPKAEAFDRIAAGADSLTFTQAAKVLGIKRSELTAWLNANRWAYRQNGSWVAYRQHIENGRLEYKEANYTDEKTGMRCCKPYCHITPKGLAKLAVVFGADLKRAA